jgi:hypothetical protein
MMKKSPYAHAVAVSLALLIAFPAVDFRGRRCYARACNE